MKTKTISETELKTLVSKKKKKGGRDSLKIKKY